MVHQHYRSSERGMAGMFPLQQVLLDFFFLQHDIIDIKEERTFFSVLELETFNYLRPTINSFQRLCITEKVSK